MNWRKLIVLNRLPIAVVVIGLGILVHLYVPGGVWMSWIFFLLAILMVVAHFLLSTITLIQKSIENGDVEEAQLLLKKVKRPQWLYKPLRSVYYMLKSQFATVNNDFDSAEADIRKSLEYGIDQKEFEGPAYLQLGTLAYRKGNKKEAYDYLKKSIQLGLPDKDTEANAYLSLASICSERRDFKGMKFYYNKAVACRPQSKEIKQQIDSLKSYISRIPG
jgi:tetratricopeptide (TPR) repeat protein